METKPYLIFSLHNLQYAVDTNLVQEIFHLPELTPIPEAPDDIVGLLNLRGQILPVMHLDRRFGNQLQECQVNDSVIVLQWEKLQIGIIVTSVHEVKNISSTDIEGEISYGRIKQTNSRFIAGVAKLDADMIMLLNHEKLLSYSDAIEDLFPGEATNGNGKELEKQFQENQRNFEKLRVIGNFYDLCCPNATSQERAIFRERSDNLRRPLDRSDFTGLMPLAVVGLNGEYFGFNLQIVREFTSIRNVTPVPCCPDHVIGNMNLRGEIVTLVDIRKALNLPNSATNAESKAIVVNVNDVAAGIPVDQVFDVMYLNPSEVKSVPAAVHSGSNEYLQGTAPYQEKMLSILDLSKILTQGGLTVNEEV